MSRAEASLRILFVSGHYPPEVNAPANRLAAHARWWVRDGHRIDVLTAVPSFPEGVVHEGYRNRLTVERAAGVRVIRVPIFLAANRGVVRRSLSFGSFMASATWHSRRARDGVDVVVGTSPQPFVAAAAWRIARRLEVPFVLEIRDLWPDSMEAVGVVRSQRLLDVLRRVEAALYRAADRIVVVTDSFETALRSRGVPSEKIAVVKNGVDLARLDVPGRPVRDARRKALQAEDRFVAAYVGTIGMAHRLGTLLDAAEMAMKSADPRDGRFLFLIMGAGAGRRSIEERLRGHGLGNVILLDKHPRREALETLAAADASIVHLRRSKVFRSVIPSKIFEAMALGIPVVLGVEGEAREIVERSDSGIFFEPENPRALLEVLRSLRDDPQLRERHSTAGPAYVAKHHDRRALARRYADILRSVAGPHRTPSGV